MMKEYLQKKNIGFYLTAVAALLAFVGIGIYQNVMYRFFPVYLLLMAAILLKILVAVASRFVGSKELFNFLPVINAVLMALAVVGSFFLMVNQIGYVMALLDPVSTITSLIVFVVIGIIAMVLNIIAAFGDLEQ